MATAAPVIPVTKISAGDASEQLYLLIESAFDREGLTEEQRDARYASLTAHLDAKDNERARSQGLAGTRDPRA